MGAIRIVKANPAYFVQTRMAKRHKDNMIRPVQRRVFYLQRLYANFELLSSGEKARFIREVNLMFRDDHHMMEHWSSKLGVPLKDSLLSVD